MYSDDLETLVKRIIKNDELIQRVELEYGKIEISGTYATIYLGWMTTKTYVGVSNHVALRHDDFGNPYLLIGNDVKIRPSAIDKIVTTTTH